MCIDSYADISIHTPTRGTTAGTGTATNLAEFQSTFPREERPYYTIVRIQVLQFQSTLPREERHMTVQLHPHRRRFQSTLPREERPSLYLLGAHLHNFNPRSHERSDSQQSELITMLRISIHAPTRGATQVVVARVIYRFNFNPRSHERSDEYAKPDSIGDFDFNPRSHERSDILHLIKTD